jgi:hypothetical protein
MRSEWKKVPKMMKKNEKKSHGDENFIAAAEGGFAAAARGLWYMSETDAEIVPFVWKEANSVTPAAVLEMLGAGDDATVEEVDPDTFFARLTTIQDWFGDGDKARAAGFDKLYEALQAELGKPTVFRIGNVQIDIVIAGIDAGGHIAGVRTRAVET